jgi:two-component system, OmpR family, KDP operon response regulator KdpE
MTGHRVLVVDDEVAIRRLLRSALTRVGYEVVEATNAREALDIAAAERPAVILLDLGLPDRDGLELVTLLKRSGEAAVLVVSAREDTEDKVAALDLGADDYVTKPFDTEELLARVRTALRHAVAPSSGEAAVKAGVLTFDLVERRVTRSGADVRLTRKEFAVLAVLVRAGGRVVTHAKMLEAGWPDVHDRHVEYLRIVMRNLRQKLEDDPAQPVVLTNELGVGYRLVIDP